MREERQPVPPAASAGHDESPAVEKPIPTWQKLAALALALGSLACVIAFHSRLHADFWPLDESRVGPNLIASLLVWAALFIAAILIWPPTRRRLHRFVDRKLESLKAHQDEHNAWVHQTLHRMHVEVTGEAPAPHPHFDDPD